MRSSARRGWLDIRHLLFCIAAVLSSFGAPQAAYATPITYYFSGTFELLFGAAPAGLGGTAFSGTLVYDPAAPVQSTTANSIVYAQGSASLSIQTVLGGAATDPGTGLMRSLWDTTIATGTGGLFSPADDIEVAGASVTFDPALSIFQILNIQLVDGTGGTADDPFGAPLSAVPTTLLFTELDAAEIHLFAAGVVGGVFQTIASATGRLTCLSSDVADCALATAVPEPTSLALLVVGLFGLVATRARRRPGYASVRTAEQRRLPLA